MTSLLPEEECNVTRLKKKSQSHGIIGKSCTGLSLASGGGREETRSFLEFSRENLSISNSELEQGFNRGSSRSTRCCNLCSRQTLLSCAALLLALSCAGLEVWKLRRVLANARDIEEVKKDVDGLKHRFLERDLLDELKAFEEQLYGEGGSEEDADVSSSTDYDSSYDDSSTTSSPGSTTAAAHHSSSTTPPCTTSKDLEDVLAVLRRAEIERGREFTRERERLLEEERERRRRTQTEKAKRKRKKRSNPFHT